MVIFRSGHGIFSGLYEAVTERIRGNDDDDDDDNDAVCDDDDDDEEEEEAEDLDGDECGDDDVDVEDGVFQKCCPCDSGV